MKGAISALIVGVTLLALGAADFVVNLHTGKPPLDAADVPLLIAGAAALGVHTVL